MELILRKNFSAIATGALGYLGTALGESWRDTAVHIIFGAFMGGLALLLALLFAGVPIVGS
jgi:hypothetical protein